MKYRVWRSLDRPSAFFGIRGRFAYVFLGIAGAGALLSLAVGSMTGSFLGMAAFAAACVGDYLLVLSLQGKMTDRGLSRRTASRKTPRCVRMQPRSIRSYLISA